MGAGSKFSSALSTRGGKSNFITGDDISSGLPLAKEILDEMKSEGIKFSKEKIVFAARLENGNKIFLETSAIDHIIDRHANQFEKTFGAKTKSQITNILCETIAKGKLVKASVKEVNGKLCYSNTYYYKGKYSVVYGIANNGYIETAYPRQHKGGIK